MRLVIAAQNELSHRMTRIIYRISFDFNYSWIMNLASVLLFSQLMGVLTLEIFSKSNKFSWESHCHFIQNCLFTMKVAGAILMICVVSVNFDKKNKQLSELLDDFLILLGVSSAHWLRWRSLWYQHSWSRSYSFVSKSKLFIQKDSSFV